MKKLNIEGQLDIFSNEIISFMKENEKARLGKKGMLDPTQAILEKYSDANRIIRTGEGRFAVEYTDETKFFYKNGNMDYKNKLGINVLPSDTILLANIDFNITGRQKKTKLIYPESKGYKFIKRKGDKNLIVISKDGTVKSITPGGWILNFDNKSVVYDPKEIIEEKKVSKEIKVGADVEVEYKNKKYIGKVHSIYGPALETINVVFEGMHTAFNKSNVVVI